MKNAIISPNFITKSLQNNVKNNAIGGTSKRQQMNMNYIFLMIGDSNLHNLKN